MAKLPNIIEKERSLWAVIKFVMRESLKGSKKYSALRYATSSISTALSFIGIGALAIVVNEFVTRGTSGARVSVLIWSFALIALSNVLPAIVSAINDYFTSVQQDDLGRHIQRIYFTKMKELDIGTVEQPEFQNILQTCQNRGASSFFSIGNLINSSIRNLVAVVIASVALAAISPLALLIIVATCLPTYFLEQKSAQLSAKIWRDNAEKSRIWGSKTMLIFNKHPLIELKNFGLVGVFLKKFLTAIGGFHADFKMVYKKQFKNDTLVQVALAMGFAGTFALLIHGVYVGAIAIGSLVFSFSSVTRFQFSLNQLFDNFGRASEHRHNISVLMDLYEMKPMIVSGMREIDPNEKITIKLKKVSFAYPGADKKVIDGLSLAIKAGDNIAIVGLNGAGKTTLIKLLTRVYDPTEGEILVNNKPLAEYNLESWKKCLGILLQEYSMYSEETIAENIMLGDVAKHEQILVQKSAAETTAHEFVSDLPEKYNQKVGTEFRGGVELSKGQKQKLALARVLYRNAPIVILDEPTASIDAVSEDTIFKNLRANHINQTRIIISHKFSNVRDSDQIILIENGKIVEQGSHDKLMTKKRGKYKKLFELQAEGYR